ncbi:MAG: hypothetical protein HN919_09365 [Verrucomicrobia bacterium]|jgi:hypothetical protein|nr:hypothetical protein [Verrucomicrobiota bacterium]MBT7066497.1 hypothetical protein [Verrucomicrobiota bacterium]MBT7699955.1 hypothetical protein [Verrucomicrobiota bacterium]
MQLPKQLAKDGVESEVKAALERKTIAPCSDSPFTIPLLTLTPELRQQLFYATSLGELTIGADALQKELQNERRGLANVNGQSERISRLLIVTNDGSPRFYRDVEYLHKQEGGRVLICLLNSDAATMGTLLGLKDKQVKAILLNRKTSVANVLKSLV